MGSDGPPVPAYPGRDVTGRRCSMIRRIGAVLWGLLLAAPCVTAQDVATGTFTVGGKAVAIKHAYAKEVPDTFAKGKTGYEVVLSDVPLVPNDYEQVQKVKAGKLHYIELT